MKFQILKFGVVDSDNQIITAQTLMACPDELPVTLNFSDVIVGVAKNPEKRSEGLFMDVELSPKWKARLKNVVYRPGGTAEKHNSTIYSFKIQGVSAIPKENDVYPATIERGVCLFGCGDDLTPEDKKLLTGIYGPEPCDDCFEKKDKNGPDTCQNCVYFESEAK